MSSADKDQKPTINDWVQYLGARLMMWLFKLLGLRRGSAFGGWIARSIGPKLGVTKRARRNLETAMPELSNKERAQIIRGMWDNLGRTIAEYPHLAKYDADVQSGAGELVTLEGFDRVDEALANGKGVVLLSGHFANWEILPISIGKNRKYLASIYRAPNNPLIEPYIQKLRDADTPTLQIPKGPEGGRPLFRHLRQGKIVGILADQKLREGLPLQFFGQQAFTAHAMMQLSIKLDCPVLPGSIERYDGHKFRVTVHPALEKPSPESGDVAAQVRAYTQDMNDWLESQVRAHPDQWFWLHDRWRAYRIRREDRA